MRDRDYPPNIERLLDVGLLIQGPTRVVVTSHDVPVLQIAALPGYELVAETSGPEGEDQFFDLWYNGDEMVRINMTLEEAADTIGREEVKYEEK